MSSVKPTNVPAYLAAEGIRVDRPDLGELIVDVACGGNYYAIIDPQENFRDMADYTASHSWVGAKHYEIESMLQTAFDLRMTPLRIITHSS